MIRLSPVVALCAMLVGVSAQPLLATTATTTSLVASPTALAPGEPAKLVATVTDSSSNLVYPGTVTFYDGTRVLGSAQIVSHAGGSFAQGTATLNIASFNPGANSITAIFAGTKSFLASTSSSQTLTVTGQYATATTMAVSGTTGSYNLTGTVETLGMLPPAGNIEFTNDTTGSSLGSLSLNGANQTGQFSLSGSADPPPGKFDASVAVGDFNQDGFLDMVTDTGTLSVFLGKGDGTFAAPIALFPTPYYYSYYVGDFNNDGTLDLMGQGSTGPELFLGNGDGSFQPGIQVSLGPGSDDCMNGYNSIITDLDRDGNLDYVVFGDHATPGSFTLNEEICVARGNGDGTFKAPQNIILPQNKYDPDRGLAVGDLNGDNYPDLVISSESRENVLLGNGDGTFKAQVSYALGVGPKIALGDLDGDGHLDLVVANQGLNTINVSIGKGDGTFGPATSYPAGKYQDQPPFLLDINNDGKLDILQPLTGDGIYPDAVDVLLGKGDGTFQPMGNYLPPGLALGTVVMQGDFNGDGIPDLVSTVYPNLEEPPDYFPITRAEVFLGEKSYSVTLPAVDLPGPRTVSVYSHYTGDSNYTPSTSCDVSPGAKPQDAVLKGVYFDHITSSSVSIGWTTNSPTNGSVGYGTTYKTLDNIVGPFVATYVFPQNSPWQHDATTFHFVTFTGLTPATTYYYSVNSVAYFSGCDHYTTPSHLESFTTAAP